MTLRHLSVCLAAAALAASASADKFYFAAPDAPRDAAESVIDGVLLREQDGQYVIRVRGGEMALDKALVRRVERDDLTIARIEELEQADRQALLAAHRRRREAAAAAEAATARDRAAAEAVARREAEAAAEAEADKEMTVVVDFAALEPRFGFRPSPEVLRRLDLVKLSREIEDYLRAHGVAIDESRAHRDFEVHVDFQGALPAYGFRVYDPVIHRVDLVGLSRQVEDFLRAELRRAANRPAAH